jgi:hypothetical protein
MGAWPPLVGLAEGRLSASADRRPNDLDGSRAAARCVRTNVRLPLPGVPNRPDCKRPILCLERKSGIRVLCPETDRQKSTPSRPPARAPSVRFHPLDHFESATAQSLPHAAAERVCASSPLINQAAGDCGACGGAGYSGHELRRGPLIFFLFRKIAFGRTAIANYGPTGSPGGAMVGGCVGRHAHRMCGDAAQPLRDRCNHPPSPRSPVRMFSHAGRAF